MWGASTSAHQVEGGQHNDWSEWEKLNADRLAGSAERTYAHWLEGWDRIKPQATDPANYLSGLACDHYHRYEADFDIMHQLGMNAYRFSIEWSRVEPAEGRFDEAQIEHYRRVVAALRQQGIEPFVTLWHWTFPVWLSDEGGWLSPRSTRLFARYAVKMVQALRLDVKFWMTINEPEEYSASAYLWGHWPGRKGFWRYLAVNRRLVQAHRSAYHAIKRVNPDARVGVAKNNNYFEPFPRKLINGLLKASADWWKNDYFFNRTRGCHDFIGLNYYYHDRLDFEWSDVGQILAGSFRGKNENRAVSDLGSELYPQGIYHALTDLKKYGKPIYITENGLADAADRQRAWFIAETLKNVHQAIADGADVRGYLHWSLLDNFEWDKGFWPRFGLVEVDHRTLERRVRPSACEYSRIIQRNEV